MRQRLKRAGSDRSTEAALAELHCIAHRSASVDQYAATMARWWGVDDGLMDGILPSLRNFNSADCPRYLGFLG